MDLWSMVFPAVSHIRFVFVSHVGYYIDRPVYGVVQQRVQYSLPLSHTLDSGFGVLCSGSVRGSGGGGRSFHFYHSDELDRWARQVLMLTGLGRFGDSNNYYYIIFVSLQ